MGRLTSDDGSYEYQWASDVEFDGLRLEVLNANGDVFFDVSVPEGGTLTVNTFSNDVPSHLVTAAIAIAERDR